MIKFASFRSRIRCKLLCICFDVSVQVRNTLEYEYLHGFNISLNDVQNGYEFALKLALSKRKAGSTERDGPL